MAKKGGFGAVAAKAASAAARQSAPAAFAAVNKAEIASGSERVMKSFRIDRELAIRLKVYAAIHGISGDRIIETALRNFLADEAG